MKIKRISKTSLKYFFASIFLSLLLMASCAALIVAEKNSLKTGIGEIKTPLSLSCDESTATLTINDREFEISLSQVMNVLQSKELYALMGVLLVL